MWSGRISEYQHPEISKCLPGTVSVGDSKFYSNFQKLPEEFETYGHAESKKEFCKKYGFVFRSEINFELRSVKIPYIKEGLRSERISRIKIGEWHNGWRHCRIGRFPVQSPLGAQLGIGTQPPCKAPSDLWVEISWNADINIRRVRLSPR